MPNYLPRTPDKVYIVTIKKSDKAPYGPFIYHSTKVFAKDNAASDFVNEQNALADTLAEVEECEIDYKGY